MSQRTETGKAHEPWPCSQDQIAACVMGVYVHPGMCFCSLEVLLDSSFAVHWLSCSSAKPFFSISWPERLFQTRQFLRSLKTWWSMITQFHLRLGSFSLPHSLHLFQGHSLHLLDAEHGNALKQSATPAAPCTISRSVPVV